MARATTSTIETGDIARPKHPKRRLRRLEARLSAVREIEAKRSRQAERARERDDAAALVAKRVRQLEKASHRSASIQAEIADLVATGAVANAGPSAYCLRERRTVAMLDPQPIVMRNGRHGTIGTCPSCGAKVARPG